MHPYPYPQIYLNSKDWAALLDNTTLFASFATVNCIIHSGV